MAPVGGQGAPQPFDDASHGSQIYLRPEASLDGWGRFWAAFGYGDAGHGNMTAYSLADSTPLGTLVDRTTTREIAQAGWKQTWSPTLATEFRLDEKTFRQSLAPLEALPGSPQSALCVQTLETADPFLGSYNDLLKDRIQRGSLQVNWDPSEALHLVGGFDASKIETGASPILGLPEDATYTAAGGFLSIDWKVGALTLSGGARAANESLGGASVSPRVSAVWTLDDDSVLRAGFFTSTRSPMVLEKFGALAPSPFLPFYLVRNPDLQAEKTTDWEVGYRRNWSRVTLDATGFCSEFRRMIMLSPEGPSVQGAQGMAFQNRSGLYRDSGVEVTLTAELGAGVQAGWSGSTSRFKDPVYGLDQQADYSPKAQSSLWLRLREGIWFGYAGLQESGAYTVVVPGGQDRQTLDARLQAQFRIGVTPLPHWSISLYGFNALREAQPVSNMALVDQNALYFTRREWGLQTAFQF
jgi:outer membrane receptor protein involved in Fe transport